MITLPPVTFTDNIDAQHESEQQSSSEFFVAAE